MMKGHSVTILVKPYAESFQEHRRWLVVKSVPKLKVSQFSEK